MKPYSWLVSHGLTAGSEKHTVTQCLCKSLSPRVKGIFICGNRMVPSFTVDSLSSHFFIFGLSKPQIWTIHHFNPPRIIIFPEPKSNKYRVQRALSHSREPPAPLLQGLQGAQSRRCSRTCHTQQTTTPECVKGGPRGLTCACAGYNRVACGRDR